jgi:hypothetical protein
MPASWTYLNTSNKPRKGVGDTVRNQLAVDIKIILLHCGTQGWHIDGHVDDAKERQGEHGRDAAGERRHIDKPEF